MQSPDGAYDKTYAATIPIGATHGWDRQSHRSLTKIDNGQRESLGDAIRVRKTGVEPDQKCCSQRAQNRTLQARRPPSGERPQDNDDTSRPSGRAGHCERCP
jgi:hypothetical protein